jgi:hypothetical protein
MQDSVVGFLFNVVTREDIQGISGEIWIDVDKAAEVVGGAEVLRKLQAGEPLEVSTAYYTIVDNIPGEWKNPKTGKVEKFISSQFQIRPDHLALLPFDTGACSWKDGCGAPRINKSDAVDHTVKLNVEETDLAKKTELNVNGKQLGKCLAGAIAANSGADGSTAGIVARLAAAADITVEKVNALIAGELDFAPRRWLSIFAVVLDMDSWDMSMAAGDDNMTARHKENEAAEPIVENISVVPLTTSNNDVDGASKEPVACAPCQKSLKTKVLEILQSLGLKAAEQKEDKTEMEKKAKVDALIASDKNQFKENHREWLTAMTDEQLAALEPVIAVIAEVTPEVAPAVNAAVQVTSEVKVPVQAVDTKPTLNKEDLLAVLGVSDEDLRAAKSLNDEKKAVRNAKIDEIAAIPSCTFTKAELATFSDATLDKTLNMLQPSAYRIAPKVGQHANDEVPAPPTILLAKPGVRGVDYAVQTERNKARVN